MKNKVIYTFLIMIMMFCFTSGVKADSFTCEYPGGNESYGDEKGKEITEFTITIKDGKVDKITIMRGVWSAKTHKGSHFENNTYDKCPTISYCLIDKSGKDDYRVSDNSADLNDCVWGYPKVSANCVKGTNGKCGDASSNTCDEYNNLKEALRKCVNGTCKGKIGDFEYDYDNYRDAESDLNSYCNKVSSTMNVTETCYKSCSGLTNDLKDIYKQGNNKSSCGLSDRLIALIRNILKWVKYIIPVIVIILSILDFLKAMGSDKDDEMKRAQGRFTKRLIAAALIFIVPFILEFIFDKMGFVSNGCGIIDL